MTANLDVAVSDFRQLARHWNQGAKAKLELSCEDGSLHIQLSAVLGHPDLPHFPHPPPQHSPNPHPPSPPPPLKMCPSQMRCQERRQCVALAKADRAALNESKKDSSVNVCNDTEVEINIAEEFENNAGTSSF